MQQGIRAFFPKRAPEDDGHEANGAKKVKPPEPSIQEPPVSSSSFANTKASVSVPVADIDKSCSADAARGRTGGLVQGRLVCGPNSQKLTFARAGSQPHQQTKRCIKCNLTQEVSCFSTNNSKPDKLEPYCRDCVKKKTAERKERSQEKLKLHGPPEEKHCKGCDTTKPAAEFHIDNSSNDGLVRWCKPCTAASYKGYQRSEASKANKAAHAKQAWQTKKADAPIASKTCLKCDQHLTADKFYRAPTGAGGLASYCITCAADSDNQRRAAFKLLQLEKPDETKECYGCHQEVSVLHFTPGNTKCWDCTAEYMSNRYKSDPSFAAICKLRARHRKAFRVALGPPSGSSSYQTSLQLLGLESRHQLLAHFEPQFTAENGFTWENSGSVWEIDHILPISSFDLSDEEQRKQAFNYKNLQALTVQQNREKGAKLDWRP